MKKALVYGESLRLYREHLDISIIAYRISPVNRHRERVLFSVACGRNSPDERGETLLKKASREGRVF
jgi:hypothetical protein